MFREETLCRASPGWSYSHSTGMWLVQDLLVLAEQLLELDVRVELNWVPAHRGVPGNEAADEIASRVARGLDWDDLEHVVR